jgi:DNA repair exonuclease SbcCD ATPase subunit
VSTIIRLVSSNVKRVKAIEVRPEGQHLVVVRGNNGQGKSSLLDSIRYALAGKGAHPPRVIREGAYEATVELETEELTVLRRWDKKPGVEHVAEQITTELEVRAKDGSRLKSPQAVLDALVGDLAFDPLEFSRMKPREQRELVKRLAGVDVDPIEAKRSSAFDRRTLVNRELDSATARLKAAPDNKPPPKVDTVALMKDQGELRGKISRVEAARVDRDAALRLKADRAEAHRVAELAAKQALERLELASQAAAQADNLLDAAQEDAEGASYALEQLADKLAKASEIAAANARWEERSKVEIEVRALTQKADALTAEIKGYDLAKGEQLSKAAFPVPGLGFSADGVTLNGLPLEQASSAEQLRVAVAIAIKRNPKLRVFFVREGSLLDATSLELLRRLAEENGAQVWLEAVGEDGAATVVIRDGEAL